MYRAYDADVLALRIDLMIPRLPTFDEEEKATTIYVWRQMADRGIICQEPLQPFDYFCLPFVSESDLKGNDHLAVSNGD